ncbi:MAG: bacillithiol biosynthesis deacetylase BshB1 [Saprospiraceae bacterium]|nr:bacillithiol biosynthesis deacetylase BshB1 [Saprospiraceae bacterium]
MIKANTCYLKIKPVDILAIGVHPDDVELSCSGTLLKHMDLGYSVGVLDLTLGELGTRGDATRRTMEAIEASQKMNISFRTQLNLRDGFFKDTEDEILAIIQIIRASMPKLILANALTDRHPDHGRAAKLTSDAVFYAGLAKIITLDENENSQQRWRPKMLAHYVQDFQLEPDFVVDISQYMNAKIELIKCFDSQFFKENTPEPDTPISGHDFFEFIKSKAKVYGRPCNFEYAEAFQLQHYPGVKDIFLGFDLNS